MTDYMTEINNLEIPELAVYKERSEIQEFMTNFHQNPDVIWCPARDRTLDNQLKVTVLASGFNVSFK